jgi:2-succinyl-5-enolpyruvyl-6-hydroxy-3-cyclohexene-1-carboxylate synthase
MAMARTQSYPAFTILCLAAVAVLCTPGTAAAQALPATPD